MYDQGLLQRCLDCLESLGREVRHKNVFGMRGLLRGKQMFAAVGERSIIVKMMKAEFEPALKRAGVERFMPGGQTLGTWVEVSEDVIADDPELRDWLAAGLRAIG
jgi:TfoX/Sxy family transcriptional regulator of competence genes